MRAGGLQSYHCVCTHLILTTSPPLSSFPRRSRDNSVDEAFIVPPNNPSSTDDNRLGHTAVLSGTVADAKPIVIKKEDGFEKRYRQRCGRCDSVVGYSLGWEQFGGGEGGKGRRGNVVYLLPGGLRSTVEMLVDGNVEE